MKLFFVAFSVLLAISCPLSAGPLGDALRDQARRSRGNCDQSRPDYGCGGGLRDIYGESRNPRGSSQWVPNDRPNRQRLREHKCGVCGQTMDINSGYCAGCRNRHKPHGVPAY